MLLRIRVSLIVFSNYNGYYTCIVRKLRKKVARHIIFFPINGKKSYSVTLVLVV